MFGPTGAIKGLKWNVLKMGARCISIKYQHEAVMKRARVLWPLPLFKLLWIKLRNNYTIQMNGFIPVIFQNSHTQILRSYISLFPLYIPINTAFSTKNHQLIITTIIS